MKHITEEYGSPCNKIESTKAEFFILKSFLEKYGVEARMISACGDTCEWQIRNGYKEWVHLKKREKVCEGIIELVEEDIKSGCYRR